MVVLVVEEKEQAQGIVEEKEILLQFQLH